MKEQKELDYELKVGDSAYGFGRNWSLAITEKETGETVKSFFLGQDKKVMSRMLGKAVDDYEKEHGTREFSKLKEHIADDIITYLHNNSTESVQEMLQQMTDMKEWQLAVE